MDGIAFLAGDTARDPAYPENHLLSYLAQDYAQSAFSILFLAMEGLLNVAKRELRFLVESSIKVCFVQQKGYASSVQEKLERFDKQLSSQNISIKQSLDPPLLPEQLREPFQDEVDRIYGRASTYVHLTPRQIKERISALDSGKLIGNETAADVDTLNSALSHGLACSLALLFHSVPDYVAGDWLVEDDGSIKNWYFMKSRFIAGIDSHFDYKSERQERLSEIQTIRQTNVKFSFVTVWLRISRPHEREPGRPIFAQEPEHRHRLQSRAIHALFHRERDAPNRPAPPNSCTCALITPKLRSLRGCQGFH